jgi:hypothetical protein
MAQVPTYCSHCGAISLVGGIIGGSGPATTRVVNKRTTCPNCGRGAKIADGVYELAEDVLRLLQSPQITRDLLKAFGQLLDQARLARTSGDELQQKAENLDPKLGEAVALMRKKGSSFLPVVLFVTVAALQGCDFNLDVQMDLNRLVDQAVATVATQPQQPASTPKRE